ncbi:hypothetical protein [Virgisporangium aurantiacum]|uniref:Uncharacterized protein n=1 Tax=Virgisporangium aurantiacum TaxID=175570 RepID=A0A8J4E156_9ACTN|nr:hypothetical protein [Virgisporangium aurantiacum]GIJ57418.1 hypothetical protein Vau01_049340 [Virgisporangium aurantiacum]
MGDVDTGPTRSTAGRVTGRIATGVIVLTVVVGWLAIWNPWHLVVVERVLFLPAVGLTASAVFGCAVAAVGRWSGHQVGRRVVGGFTVALSAVQLWVTASPEWPAARHRELARSPDGERAVVVHVADSGARCMFAWTGRGPGARVAGGLGRPGGNPVVTFDGRDLVVVVADRPPSPYPRHDRERFELRLDPATGRPLDTLPERC